MTVQKKTTVLVGVILLAMCLLTALATCFIFSVFNNKPAAISKVEEPVVLSGRKLHPLAAALQQEMERVAMLEGELRREASTRRKRQAEQRAVIERQNREIATLKETRLSPEETTQLKAQNMALVRQNQELTHSQPWWAFVWIGRLALLCGVAYLALRFYASEWRRRYCRRRRRAQARAYAAPYVATPEEESPLIGGLPALTSQATSLSSEQTTP